MDRNNRRGWLNVWGREDWLPIGQSAAAEATVVLLITSCALKLPPAEGGDEDKVTI